MILVTLLQAKLCAILLLVITVAAFAPPFHSSGGRSNYYMGAVAEHTTYMDEVSSSESLLDINLSLYEKFIALASDNGAQVLVFPEFGLTATAESTREGLYPFAEIIPDVAEDPYAEPINPCAAPEEFADRPILLRMSCAARDNSLLVLVNTIDWVPCSDISNSNSNSSSSRSEDCPADGHFQYNTDVLFDENGVLVAKYHKSHEWPGFIKAYDQAPEPTTVTYSSSFGVQFGLFICFDIVFPDPAVVLVDISVRHFLYAVKQGQLGESTIIPHWSATHNATLLSANYGSGSADWKPPSDCSGIIVNGTTLDAKKVPLAVSTGAPAAAFEGENILIAAVPV